MFFFFLLKLYLFLIFFFYSNFFLHLNCAHPQGWLRDLQPGLSAVAQEVGHKQSVWQGLSTAKSLKEFGMLLERFETACRRNVV
jgi:hypothetical protein